MLKDCYAMKAACKASLVSLPTVVDRGSRGNNTVDKVTVGQDEVNTGESKT